MKRKVFSVLIALVLGTSVLISACAAPAPAVPPEMAEVEKELTAEKAKVTRLEKEIAELKAPPEVYEWNLQSCMGPGTAFAEYTGPLFADNLREMSGGRIDITLLPPAAVVPSVEAFDAVGKGVIDMALDGGAYHAGFMPLGPVIQFSPFSLTEKWQKDYLDCQLGGIEIAREAYAEHNVYLLGHSPALPYGSVLSVVPIRRPEDFNGLKLRLFGPMFGQVVERLGGSIVAVSGEELYTGLATRTFDGLMFGGPSDMHPLGLHEVAKYYTMPPWDMVCTHEMHINMDTWKALPDDLKCMLQTAWDSFNIQYQSEKQKRGALILVEWQRDWGVEVNWFSDEDMATMRTMMWEVLDELAEADPYVARYLALTKDFAKDLGLIQ